MGSRPSVLVVTEDREVAERWSGWLSRAGFVTAFCTGPVVTTACPGVDGIPCPLREWADAAVIDVQAWSEGELYGGWPERLCHKAGAADGTVWVTGEEFDPEAWGDPSIIRAEPSEGSLAAGVLVALSGRDAGPEAP